MGVARGRRDACGAPGTDHHPSRQAPVGNPWTGLGSMREPVSLPRRRRSGEGGGSAIRCTEMGPFRLNLWHQSPRPLDSSAASPRMTAREGPPKDTGKTRTEERSRVSSTLSLNGGSGTISVAGRGRRPRRRAPRGPFAQNTDLVLLRRHRLPAASATTASARSARSSAAPSRWRRWRPPSSGRWSASSATARWADTRRRCVRPVLLVWPASGRILHRRALHFVGP